MAGLGAVLLTGPILALLGTVAALLFGMACYGWGRRAAFQEIDEQRAEVRAACERAAAERVALPGQREPSR